MERRTPRFPRLPKEHSPEKYRWHESTPPPMAEYCGTREPALVPRAIAYHKRVFLDAGNGTQVGAGISSVRPAWLRPHSGGKIKLWSFGPPTRVPACLVPISNPPTFGWLVPSQ